VATHARRDPVKAHLHVRTAVAGRIAAAWFVCLAAVCGLPPVATAQPSAQSDRCQLCGGPFGPVIYTIKDKVSGDTLQICRNCVLCPNRCFICGLPVPKDPLVLSDGRCLCPRDARTAVLDPEEGHRLALEVQEDMSRLFSRFLELPEANVDVSMVDRVNLMSFKVPGNDYECPNLLGYMRPETNHGTVRYSVSLMSALPRAEFKATCAHELGHTWVLANVPPRRLRTLSPDAHEGFCELLAYLLMDAQNEQAEKTNLLTNFYTRGQLQVFIRANQDFGLNDIVDWMKYGVDARLDPANPGNVRNVEMPKAKPPANPPAHLKPSPWQAP
jgi:hypothetical protein